MVDIIKFPLHAATSCSSNVQNLQSKRFYELTTSPIYLSISKKIAQNDRLKNIPTRNWIGNSLTNSSRLLDVSKSPYSLHRKVMYQQLSRHYPSTVDLSISAKINQPQQHNITKDSTKTTTNGNGGTSITFQSSLENDDIQSLRLSDTLSKHVTIKTEPVRPANNFINSTMNPLTSWQRYWTSTHVQRRRKEATDLEPILYQIEREQPISDQTHVGVIRPDLPYPYSELYQNNGQILSNPPNTTSPTKPYISARIPDKQISSTNENDLNKIVDQVSKIALVASSFVPSSIEINSTTIVSKTQTTLRLKLTDKDEGKYLTEKSLLLSSSHFITGTQLIEDVSKAQIQSRTITTKVYKLSLPSAKPKTRKFPPRKKIQLKSLEKNQIRPLSASKRKHQGSTNQTSGNKSEASTLSTIMKTIPRSKYSQTKWTDPYVSFRFDPPTPPCSPSLFVWIQDSDQEDNDTLSEKSGFFTNNSTVRV